MGVQGERPASVFPPLNTGFVYIKDFCRNFPKTCPVAIQWPVKRLYAKKLIVVRNVECSSSFDLQNVVFPKVFGGSGGLCKIREAGRNPT